MKKLSILCIAAAALLLSSCASSKVEEVEAPNYEGAWEVEEFVIDGAAVTGATATMEIVPEKDNYKVAGNAGVNQYFGNFAITADSIAPVDKTVIGATLMSGLPEAMAYEDAFLKVLEKENTIALVDGKLVISNDTAKITFVEAAPAAVAIEE